MTLPSSIRTWGLTVVMAVMSIGIIIEAAMLLPVVHRQAMQAEDGRKARVTQCDREPVLRKLVTAGAKYRLLTGEDVDRFRSTAPRGCPAPSATP